MDIFKKLDRLLFRSFVKRLEDERNFLASLQKRGMSVDDGIAVLDKLIAEERSCNIVI